MPKHDLFALPLTLAKVFFDRGQGGTGRVVLAHYLVKLCPNSSDSLLPNDLVMHIFELCDTYMTYEGLGGAVIACM